MPTQLRVKKVNLSYSNGNENPVDKMTFYDKLTGKIGNVDRKQVTLIIPSKFQETVMRLYVTSVEQLEAARTALNKLSAKRGVDSSNYDKIDKSPNKNKVKNLPDLYKN